MKKSIIILIVSTIAIILILSCLAVFAGSSQEDTLLQDKITQEIEYLDRYIIALLGDFDSLTIGSYLKEEKSSNIQVESDRTMQEDEAKTQQSNTYKKDDGKKEEPANNKQSNILANEGKYTTKWDLIQDQIEELYHIWNTVNIDLHSVEIDGKSILAFSNYLNDSTQNIKKKDKLTSMESIVKLYQLLPKYSESYKPDSKETNMLKIQSNIVTAYVNVSNDKWQEAQKQLAEASSSFTNLLNSVNQDFQNRTTVSQCYVMINELNKAVNLKDKEIFFIQYQNLMGKMDII